MVHQKIAGNGGDPGHERAPLHIVGIQRAVHLDEDLLREVLGVIGRPREAIAGVIDSPVVALHNLLPGARIACDAATDQQGNGLCVFQPALPGTPGL